MLANGSLTIRVALFIVKARAVLQRSANELAYDVVALSEISEPVVQNFLFLIGEILVFWNTIFLFHRCLRQST